MRQTFPFFLNDSPLAKRNMVQLLSQSSVLLEGNIHGTVRSLVFNGTTLESSFGNYRWANNRMKQDFYSLCFVRLCRNFFTSPGGKLKMDFKLVSAHLKNIWKGIYTDCMH